MSKMVLEHVNMTVPDAVKSAKLLCRLFDWKIRWQGSSLDDGYTVHVGDDERYIAFYAPPRDLGKKPKPYTQRATLAHIGVLVEDIDMVEQRVLGEGFTTFSHLEYDPGKRFYFLDEDGIEYEVVSYQ